MRLSDLTNHAGEWLRGAGPLYDVVISTRVRLARNLAGYPFLSKCTPAQRQEICDRLREAVLGLSLAPELFYVDVEQASDLNRRLLVERHLVSRQHAEGQGARGVAISGDETLAVMVCEEDHLRIQVLRSGLELDSTYAAIDRIDDLLESQLVYAFSGRFGYLTACPTNVGTGIRVSVMLHLPALRMTGEIEKVFRAARDMRLAIRGLYGEGTEALGDFFQLSNQTTLGRTEDDILRDFRDQILPRVIEYELRAREGLISHKAAAIDDRIHRALGLLRSARLISSEETLGLLSHLRMGVNLGRLPEVSLATVNELFLLTQPAHLQKIHGREMDPDERAEVRAAYIRKRLNGDA